MSGFTFEISGLTELTAKFKNLPIEIEKVVQKDLNKWANNTASDAKEFCPFNEGHLAGSIAPDYKRLNVSVVVAANYAAYLEFGTRKYAAAYVSTLPSDWQTFAARFRGKGGGTMEEFIVRLMKWIKLKGLGDRAIKYQKVKKTGKLKVVKNRKQQKINDEAFAYQLALHIIRNGIRPQPYLFPAVEIHTPKLIEDLKRDLNAK